MNKIFYISGPMEGYENNNYEAFYRMAVELEILGYKYFNPHDIDVDEDFLITKNPTRQDYYRKDIRVLTYCNAIIMLKGWQVSHGALFERQVAIEMGLTVHYEEELENGRLNFR